MYDEEKRQRSSQEIRAEIEELERRKREIEEANRQALQNSINQQNNDLMQQALDQSMNNMMDL